MIQEFKDFVNKGNIVDLAVAVVLGAAFAPVVGAVVDRVLMPLIGMIIRQPNFDTLGTFACEDFAGTAPEGLIVSGTQACAGSVGAVITVIVQFLLVALAVFFIIKAYNRTKAAEVEVEEVVEEKVNEELVLLGEIRDQLKSANAVAAARRPRPRPQV